MKKGFTLIEIIIVIILMTTVGIVSIVGFNNKKTIIEKNSNVFENALEVYLSNNPEIVYNVKNNAKAAVVSLEVLKNEGLIKDNLNIDYENNYFTLTDAVLLSDPTDTCENQIELKIFANWELNKNSSEIVYICPRVDESETDTQKEIKALKEKINSLESALSLMNGSGNNWVLFDVTADTTKVATWSDVYEDLWNVVGTNNGKIKLLYNSPIVSNNNLVGENTEIKYVDIEATCSKGIRELNNKGKYAKSSSLTNDFNNNKLKKIDNYNFSLETEATTSNPGIFHNLQNNKFYIMSETNNYCDVKDSFEIADPLGTFYRKITSSDSRYSRYETSNGFIKKEIFNETYETSNSKKKILYDNVNPNLKNKISKEKYYYEYNADININPNVFYNDKFGTLSTIDNISNIKEDLISKGMVIGLYKTGNLDSSYSGYVGLNNGEIIKKGGFASYSLVLNPYSNWKTCDLSHLSNCNGEELFTVYYIPVITLDKTYAPILLTNLADYPEKYKTKYTTCIDSSQLGTKECPRIIKFSDGVYSIG